MPNIRTEVREKLELYKLALLILACVGGVLLVLIIVFSSVGVDPFQALRIMFTNFFRSRRDFTETLVKASPMVFTGLAVGVALKMRLWNIGAEGQLHMGALGAVWVALTFPSLPSYLIIPFMMFAAIVSGAFLSGIVGALKRWLNVNEILTSLLLNYVAISFMNYFIFGPWQDPNNPGFPMTATFVRAARLPVIQGTRLHAFIFLGVALAVLMWILIEKTSWGYEIRAAGESPSAAKYAGIPVERNIVVVFLLCGAIAGLGGMGEVAGLHHRLQEGIVSTNYGGLGIIVAWLSGAHPLIIVFNAFCAGILLRGSEALQVSMNVSSDIMQIVIGTLLASVLVAKFFKDYRIVIRWGRE